MKPCFVNDQTPPWRKNGEFSGEKELAIHFPTYLRTYHHESILYCAPDTHPHFFCWTHPRCVNYGVLPHKKAAILFQIVTERKKKQRQGGMLSSASSSPKKKKAKVVKEEGINPDLHASGADGVMSAVL